MRKLIYISKENCRTCTKMSQELEGIEGINIENIDGLKQRKIARDTYSENIIPSLILMEGEVEIGRISGFAKRDKIDELLSK